MSIRRALADLLGKALGVTIVRKGRLGLLFEAEHLARVFQAFAIDCVFDVGANAGQYARRIRRLGFAGQIISFEPIPELAAALRPLAARDGRWRVEELALSDADGEAEFNVMAVSQFSSLRAPSQAETTDFAASNRVERTVRVRTARLDGLIDSLRAETGFSRPFLKMDTQGADVAVATGAGARLADFVGLQSELAIKRLYEGQPDYRAAIDLYEAAGFELSALLPNTFGHFPLLMETDCVMVNRRFL